MQKEKCREYLEAALAEAKNRLLPWQYAIIHQAAMRSAGGKVKARNQREATPPPSDTLIKAVFVCDEPNSLEKARGEALVGFDAAVFDEKYLQPLGLTRADVLVRFATDLEALRKARETAPVIGLGKAAREFLGDVATCIVPHPTAIRKYGDKGQVGRKLKNVRSIVDACSGISQNDFCSLLDPKSADAADTQSESVDNLIKSNVAKSLATKQIVYGVVLDPYQFDLQGDWIPPDEIEATAHSFSGVIGFEHAGETSAKMVESWIQPYPSAEDREKAFANQPHRVVKTQFGSDMVHSGAWIMGVQLSNELWALYQAGELDAFSIGGSGVREPATKSDMPEVTFLTVRYE